MKESSMYRVDIYRCQAQLCRNLAIREREPKHKAELMELAHRWTSLVQSLEQSIHPGNKSIVGGSVITRTLQKDR